MTSPMEKDILLLTENVEKRERTARRRAVVYSLIPVVLALSLLIVISIQIRNAALQLNQANSRLSLAQTELQQSSKQFAVVQNELQQVRDQLSTSQKELKDSQDRLNQTNEELSRSQLEVDKLQNKVDQLNKELNEITNQLKYATDFKKYEFSGNLPLTIKQLCTDYNAQCALLIDIAFKKGDIGWKLNGTSPNEGFDSPGFAAYMLNEYRDQAFILSIMPPIPSNPTQDDLQKLLGLEIDLQPPGIGDMVYYEAGYTMFYFKDEQGEPYVIGMTPLGILALKADFARNHGYSHIPYTVIR